MIDPLCPLNGNGLDFGPYMKILVPTKRVPDTDQKIRVKPDGSDIETDGLPYVINPLTRRSGGGLAHARAVG